MYEVKDAQDMEELLKGAKEPEVVKAVLKEIATIGELSEKNFETTQKNYSDLKDLVDKMSDDDKIDVLVKEQITKLSEDISTRQNEMDKAIHKRVDDVEVALKRPGGSTDDEMKDLEAEVKDFIIACAAVKGKSSYNHLKEALKNPDIKQYVEYKESFGDYLRVNGDERALPIDVQKSLSSGIDPDGGYTVNPVMNSRIITRMFEADPIRQLASVQTISTNAMEWLVDWDEAGYEWEGETVATDNRETPTLQKKRIPVHNMATRPLITQTLIEDSAINIENWLADHVAKRFGRGEGAAFVTGDGIMRPRGFLTYDNGTSYGQIEQVNMGHATALTTDGFTLIMYSMLEELMTRGTWLMNRTTVRDTMLLKDGDGQYIWRPGLVAGQPSTILALPLRMSTTMPAVAADALSVALADWAEAYMIVDRLGITIQRDPYTQKPYVEFYTRKRVGGDVVNYQAIKLGKISA